jgi:hypothetical protein
MQNNGILPHFWTVFIQLRSRMLGHRSVSGGRKIKKSLGEVSQFS